MLALGEKLAYAGVRHAVCLMQWQIQAQSGFRSVLRQDKHIDYYVVLNLSGHIHMLATWLLVRDPEEMWGWLDLESF